MTRGEYLQAHRVALARRWPALLLPVCGVGVIVAASIDGGAAAGQVAAGCVVLAFSVWLWWGAAWLRWRQDPAQAGPFVYRFDADGIAITSPAGEARLIWARVRKVLIGRQLVVMLMAGGAGAMIPRRAVASGDWDRLERLLSERGDV